MSLSPEHKVEEISSIDPAFPVLYLNASSLKVTDCPRHYSLMTNGWLGAPGDETIRNIGNAVHKFAEMYTRSGGDTAEAVMAAIAKYPTVDRLIIKRAAARRDLARIPAAAHGRNNELLVEHTFSFPWLVVYLPGCPPVQIVICGTMDHVGVTNNRIQLVDYKTTHYMEPQYALDKYRYEMQFRFYLWTMYKWGAHMLQLEHFNLARALRMTSQVCVVTVRSQEPKWKCGEEQDITAHQLDEFEANLRRLLPYLVKWHLQAPQETLALGALNNSCQYCAFARYCHARNADEAGETLRSWIAGKHDYNPTIRG